MLSYYLLAVLTVLCNSYEKFEIDTLLVNMAVIRHSSVKHGPDLGHYSVPVVIQRTAVYSIWAKLRSLGNVSLFLRGYL